MNDELSETIADIKALPEYVSNAAWLEFEMTKEAVARACKLITELYADMTKNGYKWHKPHIAPDDEGVDLEWYHPTNDNSLCVGYEDDHWYVFGATERVDGQPLGFVDFDDVAAGYMWLYGEGA